MYFINSNIFVVSTAEHFWENIFLLGKYVFIGKYLFIHSGLSLTSAFGEFISPAEMALVCLEFILSFIKFCSLVTKLWLI